MSEIALSRKMRVDGFLNKYVERGLLGVRADCGCMVITPNMSVLRFPKPSQTNP